MQSLPGFRDFLPDDCAARNYVFRRWREVARRYGFVEWDGPVLEPTDLYRKKSGAEIVDQLFNFTDKGDREIALRPELTPTLARVVATHEREFRKPLKWFSIGQFFRYEKQQRGRLREHFQLNCDIVGEADFTADIELVALCIDNLRAFGLAEGDFVVRMSDREFWTDFLRANKVASWPTLYLRSWIAAAKAKGSDGLSMPFECGAWLTLSMSMSESSADWRIIPGLFSKSSIVLEDFGRLPEVVATTI